MIRSRRLFTIFFAVVSLTLATPHAGAQPISDTLRREMETIVKDYLLAHPEVLQEAVKELERRQTEAEREKNREGVKQNSQALFYSPRQVVIGNRDGDVTLVEFFDYNCAYCKRALSDLIDLMKSDPKLRIVLKEFPVLGQGSLEAAQVAVAVRMQDASGKKYLEFHQKLLGGQGQVDRARALNAAKAIGMDLARLKRDMASEEVQATIVENAEMAKALGLNGTPSYVVGTDVVVGAVGLAVLKERINAARQSNGG